MSKEHLSLPEKVAVNLLADALLVTAFALNFQQRKAIRERDGNKCQFPVPNHRCNGTKRLEVNHIIPQKYAKKMGIIPDFPENLLTLCQNAHTGDPSNGHHVDPIHPDVRDARKKYGFDKEAIAKAIKEQQEKLDERMIYWNPQYDRQMTVLAIRNSQKEDKKRGGRRKWWPWS